MESAPHQGVHVFVSWVLVETALNFWNSDHSCYCLFPGETSPHQNSALIGSEGEGGWGELSLLLLFWVLFFWVRGVLVRRSIQEEKVRPQWIAYQGGAEGKKKCKFPGNCYAFPVRFTRSHHALESNLSIEFSQIKVKAISASIWGKGWCRFI